MGFKEFLNEVSNLKKLIDTIDNDSDSEIGEIQEIKKLKNDSIQIEYIEWDSAGNKKYAMGNFEAAFEKYIKDFANPEYKIKSIKPYNDDDAYMVTMIISNLN